MVGTDEVLKDTPGRFVLRRGDRVHRTAGPNARDVHALLRHLAANGFGGSPRALGFDADGREVLSFVPGRVSAKPYPAEFLTLAGCRAIGRLLRRAHDASRDFVPPPGARWFRPNPRPDEPAVMTHGDLHPANIVWTDGEPVAFIDWDLTSLAPAVVDLGYLAWRLAPLRSSEWARAAGYVDEPDRVARLAALLEGYGRHTATEVVDALVEFLQIEQQLITERGGAGLRPWAALRADGLHHVLAREERWIDTHARRLVGAG